jgi:Predicted ATPases of PP-loop superfamily
MEQEKQKTVLNWSSGKDAAMAYSLLQHSPSHIVTQLLTTVSSEHERIVMHGVREELLDAQAERIGLPLKKIYLPASRNDNLYKQAMADALSEMQAQGIHTAAYGDIFLEDLRIYREQQLHSIGMQALFPLWKKDTRAMIQLIEQLGIDAMLVCVNEKFLGKEFLGRKVNAQLLADLPANVDPCGENGEFHTFVYNTPYFSTPVPVVKGEISYHQYTPAANDKDQWNTGFYFLDLHL